MIESEDDVERRFSFLFASQLLLLWLHRLRRIMASANA